MKKIRLSALALCGAMALSLTSCGSKESEATPTPEITSTPEAVETTQPTATPEVTVEPTLQPEETPEVTPDSTPSQDIVDTGAVATPTPAPAETTKPVETPAPEVTPDSTPSSTETATTAADVYTKVSAVAGGNGMADMSFVLEEFYDLSAADLEDFVLYMPEMSTTLEEIFIAKVADGKMESVKSACESRQKGLKEDSDFYPTTAAYIDGYKIVTNGNWILFAVVQYPDAAVTAFTGCTK